MFVAPGEDGNEQLLGKKQRVLLELTTVLYFIAKNSAVPLLQQYVYHLVDLKHNYTGQRHAILDQNVTKPTKQDLDYIHMIAENVNREGSEIVLYLNIAELLPSAIIVLLLGCYSDYIGKRKFLMWLPCVGNALLALGYVLPLYITGGKIDHPATKTFLVVASILSGLSGNLPAFLSGNASYISDTDTVKRRTLRLAIVECIIGVTFGVANFANGFWINATDSFEQPLWFIFFCSLVPLFIILFLLKEPSGELSYELSKPVLSGWRNIKGIRHLFTLGTVKHKKLWAIFCAFQVYIFVQQGQERTFVLFLQNSPLFWRAIKIGCFFLVLYGLGGLGSWPGLPLMQRCTGDVAITILAIVSKAMGSFIMAFATDDFTVFLSCVVQVFHLLPYATARSILSKQVGDDEQGSVYAMTHSVQAIVGFLGPLLHNVLFASTMRRMSGFVFLVSGPLLVIPFMFLLYIKYLDRDQIGYDHVEEDHHSAGGAVTPMSEKTAFASKAADSFGTINAAEDATREEIDEYHAPPVEK